MDKLHYNAQKIGQKYRAVEGELTVMYVRIWKCTIKQLHFCTHFSKNTKKKRGKITSQTKCQKDDLKKNFCKKSGWLNLAVTSQLLIITRIMFTCLHSNLIISPHSTAMLTEEKFTVFLSFDSSSKLELLVHSCCNSVSPFISFNIASSIWCKRFIHKQAL